MLNDLPIYAALWGSWMQPKLIERVSALKSSGLCWPSTSKLLRGAQLGHNPFKALLTSLQQRVCV